MHGNTRVLGIRDCSVQRDKQKVIEESDSTVLPDRLREEVLQHTAALADEVGYVGAGTVEFIYDLKSDAVYFMEMNTRLQVEHPVTERVQAAPGGELVFRPQPGQVAECSFPEDEGVEIIAAAAPGKFISPYYDSMIAQVVVYADDRAQAIEKLAAYLRRVRVTGICTNIPLLKHILDDEVFQQGVYDTGYLPGLLARLDADELIAEIEGGAGEVSGGIDMNAIRIDESDELKVLSPATAIFYGTPTPTEPPYVSVGDRVKLSDTLCQLEAMKIFTPLSLADFNSEFELYEAGREYEITRINMGTGQQVNAGDLLFVVRPV